MKPDRQELTRYSEIVDGAEGNYRRRARFDITGGFLGITQLDAAEIAPPDRVLLSPNQVARLIEFLKDKPPAFRRRAARIRAIFEQDRARLDPESGE